MVSLKYALLLEPSTYSFFLVKPDKGNLEDRNKLVYSVISSLYSLDFSFISCSPIGSVLISEALLILLKPSFVSLLGDKPFSYVGFDGCLGNNCLSGQIFSSLCSVDVGVVFSLLSASTSDPLFLNVIWEVLKVGYFCSCLSGFDSLKSSESLSFFFIELYFMKAVSYFLQKFSCSFSMMSFFPSLAMVSFEACSPNLLFFFQSFLEEVLKQCSPVVLSFRGFVIETGFVIEGFLVSPDLKNKFVCLASVSWLISFLGELGVCDNKGIPIPQFRLYVLDHKSIVSWYSFVFFGLMEVFGGTYKVKSFLGETHKILWGSCARVLAAKLKLGSVSSVYRKFGSSLYSIDNGFPKIP